MPRILCLSTLFPNAAQPNLGLFVARSVQAAARAGDELVMISPNGVPPWPLNRFASYRATAALPLQDQWQDVPVLRPSFSLIPRFGASWNPALIARIVLPLARRLHAERPFDLVDAQFFYPDGPAAMRIADALGLPFTVKARGADVHYWGSRVDTGPQVMQAATRAVGLLAVSSAMRDDMAAMGMDAGKIRVHYTGIDRSRFRMLDRAAQKAKWGFAGRRLIVSVGALIPRKQQDRLIRALPLIADADLALAGAGESEGVYRALAQEMGVADRVHFLGPVPHDELPGLLSAADVMALVSKSEGLANAWVEALACGTPIVISEAGGAAELLKTPDFGRIVAAEPDAIAAAISDLLANPAPQETVAAAVSHFSWEENGQQLVQFHRDMIG